MDEADKIENTPACSEIDCSQQMRFRDGKENSI